MICITFRVPEYFLATLFHVNVREYHSALWHFSSGSDEYIYNSATVQMWQQKSFSLPSPSEKMCRCQQLRCGTLIFIQHVWNPLSTGLLAVQWASKHTVYRYSNFCCNCYAHRDAVFFEHSTNMLQISHLLWLSAYHYKEHILYSSTHPPGAVSQNGAWVTSPSFKASSSHGIFTSRKQKLSQLAQLYTTNFLAAILSPLFS